MKLTLDTTLTPEQLAEAFCELDDEQQADFFIACARIALAWRDGGYQWHLVGRHLRTCDCATDDARMMIRDLAGGLEEAHAAE